MVGLWRMLARVIRLYRQGRQAGSYKEKRRILLLLTVGLVVVPASTQSGEWRGGAGVGRP